MKIAVFPGSFDPITRGHAALVKRALPLFDKIIVAVGINSTKKYLFSLEQRLEMLHQSVGQLEGVEVDTYQKLTVHYCQDRGAGYLLRGLRSANDLHYEGSIAYLNRYIGKGLETIFLISEPEYAPISSTIVREIIRGGEDATPFLPEGLRLPEF